VWFLAAGVVVGLAALVPPFSTLSRRYEYAESLQFSMFAIVIPALVAVGAPWRWTRLAARPGLGASGASAGPLDRLADGRRRHPELVRTLGFIVIDLLVVVAWRTPGAVRAVAGHGWLAPVEAVILTVFGLGLWLELVESPPLVARSGPLRRAVLAAIIMWVFWVDAYVVGLSNDDWYPNFHHMAGHGLSAAADQQFAAVILWFVAGAAFVPIVFLNALRWLRSEEDSDAELYRLTKAELRRAPTPPPASGPRGDTPPRPDGHPLAG
jgi:hypothetical protein